MNWSLVKLEFQIYQLYSFAHDYVVERLRDLESHLRNPNLRSPENLQRSLNLRSPESLPRNPRDLRAENADKIKTSRLHRTSSAHNICQNSNKNFKSENLSMVKEDQTQDIRTTQNNTTYLLTDVKDLLLKVNDLLSKVNEKLNSCLQK